jgi:hypothetical protein
VVAPRAAEYRDRFAPIAYEGDDRFLFKELRSNLVLRWEYALGSTLFAVWSHAQGETTAERGSLSIQEDVAALLASPSTDTILVKMAHRFAL